MAGGEEKHEVEEGTETIWSLMNEMKGAGIPAACIRADGVIVASTIAIDEATSNLLSSISNITDALMKESGDKQKEIEICVDNIYLVFIALGNNYSLCGILKDREEKKTLRQYAERIAKLL
jgi:hypothetical protein